jgi:hypothetical protein
LPDSEYSTSESKCEIRSAIFTSGCCHVAPGCTKPTLPQWQFMIDVRSGQCWPLCSTGLETGKGLKLRMRRGSAYLRALSPVSLGMQGRGFVAFAEVSGRRGRGRRRERSGKAPIPEPRLERCRESSHRWARPGQSGCPKFLYSWKLGPAGLPKTVRFAGGMGCGSSVRSGPKRPGRRGHAAHVGGVARVQPGEWLRLLRLRRGSGSGMAAHPSPSTRA